MHDDSTLPDAIMANEGGVPLCEICGAHIRVDNRGGGQVRYCEEHRRGRSSKWANPWSESLVNDHKMRGCIVCGLVEPLYLIHLHHLDKRTKKFGIAQMKSQRPEAIMEELAKTIPLCANHHAVWHWEERRECAGMTVDEAVAYIRKHYRSTMPRG